MVKVIQLTPTVSYYRNIGTLKSELLPYMVKKQFSSRKNIEEAPRKEGSVLEGPPKGRLFDTNTAFMRHGIMLTIT